VTTIGIYTRALRVLYNVCIEQDPSLRELYPFAKGRQERTKYKIKTGQGSKGDVLTAEQLRKFSKIKTDPETAAHEAKLYWMFSFYAQGMNTNDIFRLRYKDVGWDAIRYERAKTAHTESKQEIIEIPMTQAIKKIIVELGAPDKSPESFVFPLLPKRCDAERAKKLIHQKNKIINKWLGKLCESKKLPSITMYWSRHTYASLLKDAGISVEQIRELLGHGDIKTTEHYLRRFDLDSKREANASIMKKLA
jgi:integrase/recombinase XerD